jgi:pimeloyl-ACP methyl ester carboxylesterase
VRLRLFHHRDGARIAYREAGAGPGLVLWHSALLSHREFTPLAEGLQHRFRVVLPDLPLHGDSEDRPRHPYTLDWLAEVIAACSVDVAGPRPIVGGHGLGAEIVLRALELDLLHPSRLLLMPNRLHRPGEGDAGFARWRRIARAGAVPGVDRVLMRAGRLTMSPRRGVALSARRAAAAGDVARHAFADVAGNANLARSWATLARRWSAAPRRELLDVYPRLESPTLLLWADEDPWHPLAGAEEALDLLPDAQLRVVPGTGYLMAYDDPVGVTRELLAFCGQRRPRRLS